MHHSKYSSALRKVLSIAAFVLPITLLLNAYSLYILMQAKTVVSPNREYTYIGDDHPNQLPGDYGEAAMVVYNQLDHYPIDNDKAWASDTESERGGFVRLGPGGRPFSIAMYHQLHCVNVLRFQHLVWKEKWTTNEDILKSDSYHINHCFELLRQTVMCKADATLIPIDEDKHWAKNSSSDISEIHPRRCRDWTKVRKFAGDSVDKWRGVPFPDSVITGHWENITQPSIL